MLHKLFSKSKRVIELENEIIKLRKEIKELNEQHKEDLKTLVRIERVGFDEAYKSNKELTQTIHNYQNEFNNKMIEHKNKPRELNKTQKLMLNYYDGLKKKPETYLEFKNMFNRDNDKKLKIDSIYSNVSHIRKANHNINLKK